MSFVHNIAYQAKPSSHVWTISYCENVPFGDESGQKWVLSKSTVVAVLNLLNIVRCQDFWQAV